MVICLNASAVRDYEAEWDKLSAESADNEHDSGHGDVSRSPPASTKGRSSKNTAKDTGKDRSKYRCPRHVVSQQWVVDCASSYCIEDVADVKYSPGRAAL